MQDGQAGLFSAGAELTVDEELDVHLRALGHPTAPVLGFLIRKAPTYLTFQASRSQCLSSLVFLDWSS